MRCGKFVEADIGLSGVNFAAADTGTLWLVENEGNGRLSTTVPDVHIAIMGIGRSCAKLEHIVPLSSLLTRSATGQAITTYFNLITGPAPRGERDGPREMHVVLLDNGRTQAYADEQLRATLQCIRCGACMNHCPVYTRIGGHAYGTTYPGPIGKIISPHLLGLEATADLATASTLCGACTEVCPVRIPIPQLLVRLRTEANRTPGEAVAHPLRAKALVQPPRTDRLAILARRIRSPSRVSSVPLVATRLVLSLRLGKSAGLNIAPRSSRRHGAWPICYAHGVSRNRPSLIVSATQQRDGGEARREAYIDPSSAPSTAAARPIALALRARRRAGFGIRFGSRRRAPCGGPGTGPATWRAPFARPDVAIHRYVFRMSRHGLPFDMRAPYRFVRCCRHVAIRAPRHSTRGIL